MDKAYKDSLPKEKADKLKKIPKATLDAHAFCSTCGQEMRLFHAFRSSFDTKTGAKSEVEVWALKCVAGNDGHDEIAV